MGGHKWTVVCPMFLSVAGVEVVATTVVKVVELLVHGHLPWLWAVVEWCTLYGTRSRPLLEVLEARRLPVEVMGAHMLIGMR